MDSVQSQHFYIVLAQDAPNPQRSMHIIPFFEEPEHSRYCFHKNWTDMVQHRLYASLEAVTFQYLFGKMVQKGAYITTHVLHQMCNVHQNKTGLPYFVNLLLIACSYKNAVVIPALSESLWHSTTLIRITASQKKINTLDLKSLFETQKFLIFWQNSSVWPQLSKLPLEWLSQNERNPQVARLTKLLRVAYFDSAWNLSICGAHIILNQVGVTCRKKYSWFGYDRSESSAYQSLIKDVLDIYKEAMEKQKRAAQGRNPRKLRQHRRPSIAHQHQYRTRAPEQKIQDPQSLLSGPPSMLITHQRQYNQQMNAQRLIPNPHHRSGFQFSNAMQHSPQNQHIAQPAIRSQQFFPEQALPANSSMSPPRQHRGQQQQQQQIFQHHTANTMTQNMVPHTTNLFSNSPTTIATQNKHSNLSSQQSPLSSSNIGSRMHSPASQSAINSAHFPRNQYGKLFQDVMDSLHNDSVPMQPPPNKKIRVIPAEDQSKVSDELSSQFVITHSKSSDNLWEGKRVIADIECSSTQSDQLPLAKSDILNFIRYCEHSKGVDASPINESIKKNSFAQWLNNHQFGANNNKKYVAYDTYVNKAFNIFLTKADTDRDNNVVPCLLDPFLQKHAQHRTKNTLEMDMMVITYIMIYYLYFHRDRLTSDDDVKVRVICSPKYMWDQSRLNEINIRYSIERVESEEVFIDPKYLNFAFLSTSSSKQDPPHPTEALSSSNNHNNRIPIESEPHNIEIEANCADIDMQDEQESDIENKASHISERENEVPSMYGSKGAAFDFIPMSADNRHIKPIERWSYAPAKGFDLRFFTGDLKTGHIRMFYSKSTECFYVHLEIDGEYMDGKLHNNFPTMFYQTILWLKEFNKHIVSVSGTDVFSLIMGNYLHFQEHFDFGDYRMFYQMTPTQILCLWQTKYSEEPHQDLIAKASKALSQIEKDFYTKLIYLKLHKAELDTNFVTKCELHLTEISNYFKTIRTVIVWTGSIQIEESPHYSFVYPFLARYAHNFGSNIATINNVHIFSQHEELFHFELTATNADQIIIGQILRITEPNKFKNIRYLFIMISFDSHFNVLEITQSSGWQSRKKSMPEFLNAFLKFTKCDWSNRMTLGQQPNDSYKYQYIPKNKYHTLRHGYRQQKNFAEQTLSFQPSLLLAKFAERHSSNIDRFFPKSKDSATVSPKFSPPQQPSPEIPSPTSRQKSPSKSRSVSSLSSEKKQSKKKKKKKSKKKSNSSTKKKKSKGSSRKKNSVKAKHPSKRMTAEQRLLLRGPVSSGEDNVNIISSDPETESDHNDNQSPIELTNRLPSAQEISNENKLSNNGHYEFEMDPTHPLHHKSPIVICCSDVFHSWFIPRSLTPFTRIRNRRNGSEELSKDFGEDVTRECKPFMYRPKGPHFTIPAEMQFDQADAMICGFKDMVFYDHPDNEGACPQAYFENTKTNKAAKKDEMLFLVNRQFIEMTCHVDQRKLFCARDDSGEIYIGGSQDWLHMTSFEEFVMRLIYSDGYCENVYDLALLVDAYQLTCAALKIFPDQKHWGWFSDARKRAKHYSKGVLRELSDTRMKQYKLSKSYIWCSTDNPLSLVSRIVSNNDDEVKEWIDPWTRPEFAHHPSIVIVLGIITEYNVSCVKSDFSLPNWQKYAHLIKYGHHDRINIFYGLNLHGNIVYGTVDQIPLCLLQHFDSSDAARQANLIHKAVVHKQFVRGLTLQWNKNVVHGTVSLAHPLYPNLSGNTELKRAEREAIYKGYLEAAGENYDICKYNFLIKNWCIDKKILRGKDVRNIQVLGREDDNFMGFHLFYQKLYRAKRGNNSNLIVPEEFIHHLPSDIAWIQRCQSRTRTAQDLHDNAKNNVPAALLMDYECASFRERVKQYEHVWKEVLHIGIKYEADNEIKYAHIRRQNYLGANIKYLQRYGRDADNKADPKVDRENRYICPSVLYPDFQNEWIVDGYFDQLDELRKDLYNCWITTTQQNTIYYSQHHQVAKCIYKFGEYFWIPHARRLSTLQCKNILNDYKSDHFDKEKIYNPHISVAQHQSSQGLLKKSTTKFAVQVSPLHYIFKEYLFGTDIRMDPKSKSKKRATTRTVWSKGKAHQVNRVIKFISTNQPLTAIHFKYAFAQKAPVEPIISVRIQVWDFDNSLLWDRLDEDCVGGQFERVRMNLLNVRKIQIHLHKVNYQDHTLYFSNLRVFGAKLSNVAQSKKLQIIDLARDSDDDNGDDDNDEKHGGNDGNDGNNGNDSKDGNDVNDGQNDNDDNNGGNGGNDASDGSDDDDDNGDHGNIDNEHNKNHHLPMQVCTDGLNIDENDDEQTMNTMQDDDAQNSVKNDENIDNILNDPVEFDESGLSNMHLLVLLLGFSSFPEVMRYRYFSRDDAYGDEMWTHHNQSYLDERLVKKGQLWVARKGLIAMENSLRGLVLSYIFSIRCSVNINKDIISSKYIKPICKLTLFKEEEALFGRNLYDTCLSPCFSLDQFTTPVDKLKVPDVAFSLSDPHVILPFKGVTFQNSMLDYNKLCKYSCETPQEFFFNTNNFWSIRRGIKKPSFALDIMQTYLRFYCGKFKYQTRRERSKCTNDLLEKWLTLPECKTLLKLAGYDLSSFAKCIRTTISQRVQADQKTKFIRLIDILEARFKSLPHFLRNAHLLTPQLQDLIAESLSAYAIAKHPGNKAECHIDLGPNSFMITEDEEVWLLRQMDDITHPPTMRKFRVKTISSDENFADNTLIEFCNSTDNNKVVLTRGQLVVPTADRRFYRISRTNEPIPVVLTEHEIIENHKIDWCKEHGYMKVLIDGDGNCLFRFLSLIRYNTPDHHLVVRNTVAMYCKIQHRQWMSYFEVNDNLDEFYDLIDKFASPGYWPNHALIRVAFHIYQVNVTILRWSYEQKAFIGCDKIVHSDQYAAYSRQFIAAYDHQIGHFELMVRMEILTETMQNNPDFYMRDGTNIVMQHIYASDLLNQTFSQYAFQDWETKFVRSYQNNVNRRAFSEYMQDSDPMFLKERMIKNKEQVLTIRSLARHNAEYNHLADAIDNPLLEDFIHRCTQKSIEFNKDSCRMLMNTDRYPPNKYSAVSIKEFEEYHWASACDNSLNRFMFSQLMEQQRRCEFVVDYFLMYWMNNSNERFTTFTDLCQLDCYRWSDHFQAVQDIYEQTGYKSSSHCPEFLVRLMEEYPLEKLKTWIWSIFSLLINDFVLGIEELPQELWICPPIVLQPECELVEAVCSLISEPAQWSYPISFMANSGPELSARHQMEYITHFMQYTLGHPQSVDLRAIRDFVQKRLANCQQHHNPLVRDLTHDYELNEIDDMVLKLVNVEFWKSLKIPDLKSLLGMTYCSLLIRMRKSPILSSTSNGDDIESQRKHVLVMYILDYCVERTVNKLYLQNVGNEKLRQFTLCSTDNNVNDSNIDYDLQTNIGWTNSSHILRRSEMLISKFCQETVANECAHSPHNLSWTHQVYDFSDYLRTFPGWEDIDESDEYNTSSVQIAGVIMLYSNEETRKLFRNCYASLPVDLTPIVLHYYLLGNDCKEKKIKSESGHLIANNHQYFNMFHISKLWWDGIVAPQRAGNNLILEMVVSRYNPWTVSTKCSHLHWCTFHGLLPNLSALYVPKVTNWAAVTDRNFYYGLFDSNCLTSLPSQYRVFDTQQVCCSTEFKKIKQSAFKVVSKNRFLNVVVSRQFIKGDIVLEYCGDIKPYQADAKHLHSNEFGISMAVHSHKENAIVIDNSRGGCLATFVKPGCHGNLELETFKDENGCVHFLFVATEDIEVGKELVYDWSSNIQSKFIDFTRPLPNTCECNFADCCGVLATKNQQEEIRTFILKDIEKLFEQQHLNGISIAVKCISDCKNLRKLDQFIDVNCASAPWISHKSQIMNIAFNYIPLHEDIVLDSDEEKESEDVADNSLSHINTAGIGFADTDSILHPFLCRFLKGHLPEFPANLNIVDVPFKTDSRWYCMVSDGEYYCRINMGISVQILIQRKYNLKKHEDINLTALRGDILYECKLTRIPTNVECWELVLLAAEKIERRDQILTESLHAKPMTDFNSIYAWCYFHANAQLGVSDIIVNDAKGRQRLLKKKKDWFRDYSQWEIAPSFSWDKPHRAEFKKRWQRFLCLFTLQCPTVNIVSMTPVVDDEIKECMLLSWLWMEKDYLSLTLKLDFVNQNILDEVGKIIQDIKRKYPHRTKRERRKIHNEYGWQSTFINICSNQSHKSKFKKMSKQPIDVKEMYYLKYNIRYVVKNELSLTDATDVEEIYNKAQEWNPFYPIANSMQMAVGYRIQMPQQPNEMDIIVDDESVQKFKQCRRGNMLALNIYHPYCRYKKVMRFMHDQYTNICSGDWLTSSTLAALVNLADYFWPTNTGILQNMPFCHVFGPWQTLRMSQWLKKKPKTYSDFLRIAQGDLEKNFHIDDNAFAGRCIFITNIGKNHWYTWVADFFRYFTIPNEPYLFVMDSSHRVTTSVSGKNRQQIRDFMRLMNWIFRLKFAPSMKKTDKDIEFFCSNQPLFKFVPVPQQTPALCGYFAAFFAHRAVLYPDLMNCLEFQGKLKKEVAEYINYKIRSDILEYLVVLQRAQLAYHPSPQRIHKMKVSDELPPPTLLNLTRRKRTTKKSANGKVEKRSERKVANKNNKKKPSSQRSQSMIPCKRRRSYRQRASGKKSSKVEMDVDTDDDEDEDDDDDDDDDDDEDEDWHPPQNKKRRMTR